MGKTSAAKTTVRRPGRQANETVVRLDSVAAQPSAEALKSQCLKALSKRRTLIVDASGVERISTACVQVLLSAARSPAGAGRFAIRNPSEAFITVFSELGLFATLMQWEVVK